MLVTLKGGGGQKGFGALKKLSSYLFLFSFFFCCEFLSLFYSHFLLTE